MLNPCRSCYCASFSRRYISYAGPDLKADLYNGHTSRSDYTLCQYISRLGIARRRRGCGAGWLSRARRRVYTLTETETGKIPVRLTSDNVCVPVLYHRRHQEYRQRVLQPVRRATTVPSSGVTLGSSNTDVPSTAPALYVLNAAAITKPHAVKQLAADLNGYKTDVAVITETHLKKKHVDRHFAIDGYALFRRDRVGRRGGRVATSM